MKCTECIEQLADFLLDELPEREAVLVHEHLALCSSCMATYKELKGTGRALEAVPALRPIHATAGFAAGVKAGAHVECEKILLSLPPEKRLRIEARRAQRMQRARALTPPPSPPPPRFRAVWAIAGLVIVLLSLIAVYPLLHREGEKPQAVGVFAKRAGKVEQFYQRAREHWSPVAVGKRAQTGDEFSAGEDGRACLDLAAGGRLFLGPSCELRFPYPKDDAQGLVVELKQGELGLERPQAGQAGRPWLIQGEWGRVQAPAGVCLFIRLDRGGQSCLNVLRGEASVTFTGGSSMTVAAGERVVAGSAPAKAPPAELLPAWRADLVTDAELGRWMAGRPRVLEPKAEGLAIELNHGPGVEGSLKDWAAVPPGRLLQPSADGRQWVAGGETACRLAVPLSAPLCVELAVAPQSPRAAHWSLELAGAKASLVAAEFGAEAQLRVRHNEYLRADRRPFRQGGERAERVRLELALRGAELFAVLAWGNERTQELPLPPGWQGALELRLGVQSEGLLLDGLRVTGVLPREWLVQQLTQSAP